ncbi:MAG: prephenate dehydrogenase/arogenate dehydrogenase family protein [Verrucomicrobiales bacterium]|nr:prephenate dehydrogenase/arogenate dehydrogenase family protein [Verrucomicrobiales bacterium]
MKPFHTVSVIAPGLLGGSILKTLRRRAPATRLKVCARREATRLTISGANLADEVCAEPASAAADSDLVILCTPIQAMTDVTRQMLPALKREAVVTDVGSVKASVHAALAPLLAGRARWLGSHPMAGSENSGLAAARGDLFDQAVTILTPVDADADTLYRLRAFWELLGCRVLFLTPEAHDAAVAQVSHLPHLLAALLVNSVSDASLSVAGPGFRDTTRIAAGPPEMWADILRANRAAIISAVEKLQGETRTALAALREDDYAGLLKLLNAASERRRKVIFNG